MSPQLIITAIIAGVGFYGGWHVQTIRYTAKVAAHAKQELAQVQQSAAASIRRMDNVITAQNAAAVRGVGLRRDRDRALSELERLRSAIAGTVPVTSDAPGACVERTNTADQLLLECAADLTELAGKADRHASDVQTLMAAWPTTKE